jgi:hypothetical protein
LKIFGSNSLALLHFAADEQNCIGNLFVFAVEEIAERSKMDR